jgi:hypothetical protein
MHFLMTGTFDFLLVLTVVIQSRPIPCEKLRLATLAFSRRNVAELCRLLDNWPRPAARSLHRPVATRR